MNQRERTLPCVQNLSPFEQSWALKRATSLWSEGDVGTKRKREKITNIKNIMHKQGGLFFKKTATKPVIVVICKETTGN